MTPVTAPADPHLSRCTAYLKGEPKALGTVQIMIGIMTFLFGVILTISSLSPAIISGISLWGSLIYISSGALMVAAANNFNPCVIKASLVMNVLSAVAAGIALILFVVDMVHGSAFQPLCQRYTYDSYGYGSYKSCFFSLNMWNGVYGVLLVFSLLEFIISICISSFACKATCTTAPIPMYSQMTYTQQMSVQPMNVQQMSVQPMNMQQMNVQPMNVQPMNVQPMNVQPMNVQPMNAQPYNSSFYSPQDPQQSNPAPSYNKV